MSARAWIDRHDTVYVLWDNIGPYTVLRRDGTTEERYTLPELATPVLVNRCDPDTERGA